MDEYFCLLRKTTRCDQMILVIRPPEHERLIGAAEARHRLYQRVEDRLEVDGRAADSLEYVCGGGLLPQRLSQVFGARLHLVEQSDIADGYTPDERALIPGRLARLR
jgi:hypothetical protein